MSALFTLHLCPSDNLCCISDHNPTRSPDFPASRALFALLAHSPSPPHLCSLLLPLRAFEFVTMLFSCLSTFLVAMLVMATSHVTFANARPVHGLHHAHSLLVSSHRNDPNHKFHRHFNSDSSLYQRTSEAVRVARRDVGDNNGNVSAHDRYESQQHKLEAALKHYEEYGDAQSLQLYLHGFSGAGVGATTGDATKDDVHQVPAQDTSGDIAKDDAKQAPAKNAQQDKQAPACEKAGPNQPQPMQPQPQSPKMIKKPKKPQPQPQPQPQPADQSKQAPSHDQPNQHKSTPPADEYQRPSTPSSGSSDNSINGYTPPAFTSPPGAPSTASLYSTSAPFIGRATFYNTGLGACGIVNSDDQPIVAISRDLFEKYNPSSGNPNHNSLCGKKVEISWKGKTAYAFATDECPTCTDHALDCSPSVFEQLDNKDKGVLDGITWRFV